MPPPRLRLAVAVAVAVAVAELRLSSMPGRLQEKIGFPMPIVI